MYTVMKFSNIISRNIFYLFLIMIASNARALDNGDKKSNHTKIYAPLHEGNGHNAIHELNQNYRLYDICKNDIEGYSQKLSGGDYTYPCLREDLGDAMISRAYRKNGL